MATPFPQWLSNLFSPLSAPFLFPGLPSGAPSNPQTQTAGVLGQAFGTMAGMPSANPAQTALGLGWQLSTQADARAAATPPPAGVFAPGGAATLAGPMTPLYTPSAPPIPLGGTGGTVRTQGQRTTAQSAQPPQISPIGADNPTGAYTMVNGQQSYLALQTSDYAGRRAATQTSTAMGTDATGTEAPLTVNAEAARVNGYTPEQMQKLGYTWNADQMTWVLTGGADANAHWRTSGSNFGKVGAYGRVHGQRFASEKAWQSWQNRQKRSAKKEEDEQMNKATQVITASYGTG